MVVTFGREPDVAKRIRQAQGKRIRRARKLRGLSIQEFAEALGVTNGAVSQWETGRFTPRPAMQVRIANTLDVPHSMIFDLDSEVA